MTWNQILIPVALMGSGMAAGGLMIAVLGGAPLLLRLPTKQYVPVHQFLVTRFDPFMPICMVTAMVLDLVLIFTATEPLAQVFFGIAVALLFAAMVVSLTKNVPVNRWVKTLDPERLPANFDELDPRIRWRNWNLVRTVFVVIALAANAIAVGALL